MTTEYESTENYLLTLASRLKSRQVRSVVIVIEEHDKTITNHVAKFTHDTSWINIVGGLYAVLQDLVAAKVSWGICNADGSDVEA